MKFSDRVYAAVSSVPRGKVSTYGIIAAVCGSPRAARAVGQVLHHNPYPGVVPCHRIVNRDGRMAPGFAFGGPEAQRRMLEEEGVQFDGEFVDMERCLVTSFPEIK